MPLWAAVDTAAQLGCDFHRVCPVIPPAGIGICFPGLPDWHGARAQGVGPLPRRYEVIVPEIPANLKAGRVLVWMMFVVLCSPVAGGWQGRVAAPGGAGVVCAQKGGAKSSCCLESRRQTFRAPVGTYDDVLNSTPCGVKSFPAYAAT